MADEAHDYVIVGGGSAGCVLANRLSADPDRRVLLLEAGGSSQHLNVRIPAAFYKLFRTSRDWEYTTDAEPHLDGRSLYIPRGKMLGGSSAMNAMIYIRGHRHDYDGWASHGAAGWSADDVLPYFKRSEDNERGADTYHGTGGPLRVSDARSLNPLTERWVEAGKDAGLPYNPDFNAATQDGVGLYQLTQQRGRRWSVANAFLDPARRRRNLTVRSGAHVTHVTIARGRATGVEYTHRGRRHRVQAEGEVIVAAGAINTPQLLMLSGVGPADHLRGFDIEPIVDNPNVGSHLMDHPVTVLTWKTSARQTLDDAETTKELLRWLTSRRGLLTSNVAEGGGFVRTSTGLDAPDMQFHFAPGYFQNHGFTTYDGRGFTIAPTLVAPVNRGTLRLRSADPAVKPQILGQFMAARADVDAMVAGIDMAREIARSRPLAEVALEELHPGPDVSTREDLEGWIRAATELLYHPSCTARMGSPSDSVVSPELRVHGVERLRVADASVMPTVVRGNTNAPTIMIAEKAAEMIAG